MNKMFKFNGMPYKRSGRAGGKSVSMVGMLVLLLAALLVLPSCFDDDEVEVEVEVEVPGDTVYQCADGNTQATPCDPPDDMYDPVGELDEGECYMDGDRDGMVQGTDADECIKGEGGDDSIKGMGGKDDIDGGPGDDNLYGGEGDDKLTGGAGNDELSGGAGNDELNGGVGNNTLDGGEGDEDIAIYKYSTRVKVDLDAGTAINVTMDTDPNAFAVGGGTDTLTGIENVKGSHGPDQIDGDENANLLKGLDGADTINGAGGDDTIIPNRPANADGTANVEDPAVEDGGQATPADDQTDTVNGGDGNDTISYEGEAMTVTATLVPAEEDLANTTDVDDTKVSTAVVTGEDPDYIATMEVPAEEEGEESTYVSTIENIVGGAGDDNLTGDARDNRLEGRAGVDELNGGGGNDVLMGGGGVDTLNGGAGNDMLNGGAGADADILNGEAGNDTIHAGVNANGESNDDIDGGDGPMSEGDDTVDPAVLPIDLGVDIVSFAHIDEDTDENTEGVQGVTATIGADWNAEQVHGSPLADTIAGSDERDMIVGGAGDDTISGGGGGTGTGEDFSKATADVLVGAGGDDTLNGDSGGGSVEVFAVHVNEGGGDDTINDFTLGEDHLHFVAAAVTHSCVLGAGTSEVICTLSTDQTVTITYTAAGALSDPLDLDKDLNIVNDPTAGL